MRLIALDPATHTGWCVWSATAAGGIVASGTWDLSVRRDESGGMRLIRLRSKLAELARAYAPFDLLVFEGARHAGPGMQGALVVQSELQGVIKLWAHDSGIEFRGYSPAEIKKRATGKGNAPKPAILAAARAAWPGWTGDDNEADARWLALLAAEEYASATTNAEVVLQ